MRLSRPLFLGGRLVFLAYTLFSAVYCLITYIPFTYNQVHVGELFPWLTKLVHWHAFLFWPAMLAGAVTVLFCTKRAARILGYILSASAVVCGIALLIRPLLPNLRNDITSLVWCFVWLLPLVFLAVADWLECRESLTSGVWDHASRLFVAAMQTALFSASVYILGAIFRIWHTQVLPLSIMQWSSVIAWTLLSHLLVFFLLFALLDFALLLGSVLWQSGRGALLGVLLAVVLVVAFSIRYVIFTAIAFNGLAALGVAAAASFAFVIFTATTSIRFTVASRQSVAGLDPLFGPIQLFQRAGWATTPFTLVALGALLVALTFRISRMDWGFLGQEIVILLLWATTFGILYVNTESLPRFKRVYAYVAGVAILVTYVASAALQVEAADRSASASDVFPRYSSYDISYRLADQMLRREVVAPVENTDGFYSFLVQNSNIPRSVRLAPVDIHLAPELREYSGRKPNIFFLVIDSLRRDYLSPYNPAVTFTPAIDALARDSVVFKNAFTRYGGTGLSEPSIWVGGAMLHQQYESPFAPMNSLQKLMDANHYREWISKDNVLKQVVPDSQNIDELDKNVGAMNYDLCTSLQEVEHRLDLQQGAQGPIFVYTQAQNIHISVIEHEGRSVPSGTHIPPAFNAPYASRLQRMDACVADFISTLKKDGLYDNSIIVLTSDHGDSLGEEGRWGHAYTIFPEVVRIPMIVHLPDWMRETVQTNADDAAFLTDLTPSLYYLLGQRPLTSNPLFGRPLFTTSAQEQEAYRRSSYLLASSYGPVYGLLTNNGRRLYIADAINYRDFAYELSADGTSRDTTVSEDERKAAQNQIRESVSRIAQFYGFK